MNSIRPLCLAIVPLASACQKRDTVMTPQQEEEYAKMMREAQAKSKSTYSELQQENDRLKDEAMRRAVEK